MCTALVALSLVPLTGWAGQVSLAPLAFAGIGAVAYARLGGAHGSVWAVFLAALVDDPGRRAARVPRAAAAGSLPRAGDARVRGDGRGRSSIRSPFAVGAGSAHVDARARSSASTSTAHAVVPAPRHRRVRRRAAIGVVALRRSAFGRRLVALRDSEAASATVGVNILETKVVGVHRCRPAIAGLRGRVPRACSSGR